MVLDKVGEKEIDDEARNAFISCHKYANVSTDPIDLEEIVLAPGDDMKGKAKKAMAFVNPKSGGGKAQKTLEKIKPIFDEASVELIIKETEYAGHAIDMAKEEDLTGISYLVAIGGDGTLSEVVNGFHGRRDLEEVKKRVAIGIIPGGTGNTFAYDLGLETVEQGARAIVGNKGRLVDLIEVTALDEEQGKKAGSPWYSINIVGFGLAPAVLNRYESFRCCAFDCIRPALYEISAYFEVINNPAYKCRFEFPEDSGVSKEAADRLASMSDYAWIQAQNTVHMAACYPFCPRAKLDDGLMDLVVIKHLPRLTLIAAATTGKEGKIESLSDAEAEYVQCSEFTLIPAKEDEGANTVNIDGELKGISPMRLKVLPKDIYVCC
jgi:diacylglycerol kinase (ATP)